jgi:hypothetical protein
MLTAVLRLQCSPVLCAETSAENWSVLLQIELRKYLESVYGLSVASLRTLNYEGAKKRGKHGFYRRPDYKKVYVTFNKTDKAETS